ncbi:hypothetical protein J6590_102665, partial [Homalodisca vitripennis]
MGVTPPTDETVSKVSLAAAIRQLHDKSYQNSHSRNLRIMLGFPPSERTSSASIPTVEKVSDGTQAYGGFVSVSRYLCLVSLFFTFEETQDTRITDISYEGINKEI